jgi:hypothetical protein
MRSRIFEHSIEAFGFAGASHAKTIMQSCGLEEREWLHLDGREICPFVQVAVPMNIKHSDLQALSKQPSVQKKGAGRWGEGGITGQANV